MDTMAQQAAIPVLKANRQVLDIIARRAQAQDPTPRRC